MRNQYRYGDKVYFSQYGIHAYEGVIVGKVGRKWIVEQKRSSYSDFHVTATKQLAPRGD